MWIVQSNLISETHLKEVVNVLKNNNIDFIDVGVIPFSHDLITTDPIPDVPIIIPYGSTTLSKIAQEREWKGLFFDDDKFSVRAWNINRNDMLNQNAILMTVEQASRLFVGVPEKDWFIRPNQDLKQFNGMVTTSSEIANWMNCVSSGSFSFGPETEIAISRPKRIISEARFFIVDGKIIDGSIYKSNGELYKEHIDGDYNEFQPFADKWLPNPTCVMDLAYLDYGYLEVIEFNTFNSTGFYDHDINKILVAVNDYANKMI